MIVLSNRFLLATSSMPSTFAPDLELWKVFKTPGRKSDDTYFPSQNAILNWLPKLVSWSVEIFHHKSLNKSSTRSNPAAPARWRGTETEHTDGQAAGGTFERRRQAGTGAGGEEVI
jgi:hypothetical protein